MNWVLTAIGAATMTYITAPMFLELLRRSGAVRNNYLGEFVPVAGGFLLLWMGCLWVLISSFSSLSQDYRFMANPGLLIGLAGLGFGFMGLVDDILGSREQSGLVGHLRELFTGRLTTGALKALLGVAFGLVLAMGRGWVGPSPLAVRLSMLVVDGLLIAGSANLLNLLDLRPGRAGKSFLLGAFAVIGWGNPMSLLVLPFVGGLIGFLPYDLKGQAMMGDTGANGLGAVLGLTALYAFHFRIRLLLLVAILAIHIVAERVSLSKVIEEFPPLKALDRWGRPDP